MQIGGCKNNLRKQESNKQGFTLVELSLSLVFIAILSLAVALVISNTIASYRRGVTLNQVNTVGMDVVDDMRAAIQGSSTKPIASDCLTYYERESEQKRCEGDEGKSFVSVVRRAEVKVGGKSIGVVPVYGAFCTGTYTYIWNSGYFFDISKYKVGGGSRKASLEYNGGKDKIDNDFKLLKVRDDSRSVCANAVGAVDDKYDETATISDTFSMGDFDLGSEGAIDLLKSDEGSGGLALYDMSVTVPTESSAMNALFYAVSFILGTVQGGVNINATGNFCATPNDYNAENFNYCAINKFNFAAQATGE